MPQDSRSFQASSQSKSTKNSIYDIISDKMSNERRKKLADALEHVLQTLTREYQPEKIILFGSMVNPNIGEWSDIDLVIIKDTPLPFLQRIKGVALLCRAPVGVDFLVYTPGEFAQMVAEKNPFVLNEVIRKGQILYERQPTPAVAG